MPGWTTFTSQGQTDYQSRYLTNTGRVFFNSNDALVSADVNGKGDVYEYEPEGTGNCSATANGPSIAFKPARTFKGEVEGQALNGEAPAGCVGLISSGTASEEAAFQDASGVGPGGEEGEEVFFLTTAKLSPQDHDTSYDVYDAHMCTTVSPCIAPPGGQPPACENADACRAAPSSQPEVFGAPASATFSGPGNLGGREPNPAVKQVTKKKTVKCRRGFVKKKIKKKETCVKQKHKKSKSAKKASNDRRLGR